MENLITIEHINKEYPHRKLFNDISLGINDGDRIGIIGINGTGKSTLLRIIAGIEEPDDGKVTKNNSVRLAYLPQAPVFDNSMSVLENVVSGKAADEEFINLRSQARVLLTKFGIPDPDGSAQVLSGGTRKRAALVSTLLTPSNVLILDEPTNHLDSFMTEWLENFLKGYKGAFIMITHDRYFLDRVVNKIVELDQGKLYEYNGANYSDYLNMKAEREEIALFTEHKKENIYRIELAWMQRGARARTTKQKAHIERFNELENRDRPVIEDNVEISTLSSRLGRKAIIIDSVSKAYDGRTLIRDFSYTLLSNDRIGIIGPNGCGKSTLLKIITGIIKPDSGKVETGITVKTGYFLQENEAMPEDMRVIDYIRETADYIKVEEGTISASQMCDKFLFTGAMQYSLINRLSGGEKRRLFLLKVLMEAPNILILDEPTNDLDIKTLGILENYLAGFPGIVISVSHDRFFLDRMARRIFAFEGNGIITQYEGNYSDYKEKRRIIDERQEKEKEENSHSGHTEIPDKAKMPYKAKTQKMQKKDIQDDKKNSQAAGKTCETGISSDTSGTKAERHENKLKFTYKEQREFDTIETDIETIENQISELEKEIAVNSSDYAKLADLSGKKDELEEELGTKMERWEYLSELDSKIKAQKNKK
jgi:ATP-binding cassette subfamily F protein uup